MKKSPRQPNFERLRTALACGEPDAVPIVELGIHPLIKAAIMGRDWKGIEDDVEFMGAMGYDFVKVQPRITFALSRKVVAGHAVAAPGQKPPDRAWASEHDGVIRSWEDFQNYPWPKVSDIDYSNFERAREILPDGMGIVGQYGDIFTCAWEMMGFETFAVAICEDPELVDALFARLSELILSMFENMAQIEGVGALWFSDDIAYSTSLLVSPAFLREKFFPLVKRIGDIARERNLPLLYHTDGFLYDVLEDIIGAGVKALHPIEPKAMDIVELKKMVKGRLCLCGNIDVDLLARGTPDEIRALVRKRIEEVAPGGGYCLGSSNSVPEYVKVENYLAMVETAIQYGTY